MGKYEGHLIDENAYKNLHPGPKLASCFDLTQTDFRTQPPSGAARRANPALLQGGGPNPSPPTHLQFTGAQANQGSAMGVAGNARLDRQQDP